MCLLEEELTVPLLFLLNLYFHVLFFLATFFRREKSSPLVKLFCLRKRHLRDGFDNDYTQLLNYINIL